MSDISRFPLTWPASWRRYSDHGRKDGAFKNHRSKLSVTEGVRRVLVQLHYLGVREDAVIISTNVAVRRDGFPRADQAEPYDPGAAVYWEDRDGKAKVIATDRYTRVADNLAAIAATLEALRAIERHGGAEILDRAFTGFDALPAPDDWRTTLELHGPAAGLDEATVKAAYRRLAAIHHPDRGGSDDAMSRLNAAIEAALKAVAK